MIHEQEYTVKVKIQGKSTQQLEFIENMLVALMATQNDSHKNVKMSITTRDGIELSRENENFSFDRFMNGRNMGSNKNFMDFEKDK